MERKKNINEEQLSGVQVDDLPISPVSVSQNLFLATEVSAMKFLILWKHVN